MRKPGEASETGGAARLLVVGASGRVGRLLAPVWAAAAAPVILQRRGAAGAGGLCWAPLGGPAALAAHVAQAGVPAAMLVLAGATPATEGDLSLNPRLADACLAAAAQVGVGRVLLASSSAVYGGARAQPWAEGDTPRPTTDYGRSKLDAERIAGAWRGRGLAVTCLRIGNVAGADALLGGARPGRRVSIDRFAGGGGPVRSYIGARSLARVLLALADPALALPPVLNLAAPHPVAMADLADAAGLDWGWTPAPEGAMERLVLDCAALARLVGFDDAESTAKGIAAQWKDGQASR